jgi:hypothetical protein
MDWWIAFWTALSFFAIVFTGAVAIFALLRSAREKRDDRAAALLERFNKKELANEFTTIMPFGDVDGCRLFVRESLVPSSDPARKSAIAVTSGSAGMEIPLRRPSEIMTASVHIYNWLSECWMHYERGLASKSLVLEVAGLTALSFVYLFDPIWNEMQVELGIDLLIIRKLALRAQWHIRASRTLVDSRLGEFCFAAFRWGDE